MRILKISIVILTVLSLTAIMAGESTAARISGKLITKEGNPMQRAMVFIFDDQSGPPPSPGKYWRVPEEVITIDDEGIFTAELKSGSYYIGVVTGSWSHEGTPRGEDFRFLGLKSDGGIKTYAVKEGEENDLGLISETELFQVIDRAEEKITTIEGLVLNENRGPAEKAMVMAYPTPLADTEPLFVSDNTDIDGRYRLRLSTGGTYYIKARYRFNAKSADEETPVAVQIETGKTVTGIDLRVK
ncbi:MAG: carboxypeptidase regulatory-like domain-containing protein [Nitrospiraceae bacterium]|nr:MAG: carboxypeptidase regulatory-like domain-containing protein [Nitrospiraceae bacterium]